MSYKVENSMKTGEFDSKYGKMFKYTVKFEGETDTVEIVQKPDSPEPKTGDVLEGAIEDTQYGKKFRKEKPAFNGAKVSQRDPETQRYIMRQNALTTATNRGVCKAQELCKYAKSAKEVNKILDDELGGKHLVQVASLLAKYSEGKITVVMTPEEVANVMGYETPAETPKPEPEEEKQGFIEGLVNDQSSDDELVDLDKVEM